MPVSNKMMRKTRKTTKKKSDFNQRVRTIINKNVEQKSRYTALAGVTAGLWQFGSYLDGITQGTTASSRIGHRIFVKAINVSVIFEVTPSLMGATNCNCEVISYHNKVTNGVLITQPEVWEANEVGSIRNHNYRRKVTLDKYILTKHEVSGSASAGNATLSNGRQVVRFSIYPKKVIAFEDNTGTITGIMRDDFGWGIACTDTNCISAYFRYEVIYTDM